MLTEDDRHYAKKRKRLWNIFGWVYKGVGDLTQNGSLNCGCSLCRGETYHKRLENKRNRIKGKEDLRKEINDI